MKANDMSNVTDDDFDKSPVAGKPNFLITSKHKFSSIFEYRLFLSMLCLAYEGVDITKPMEIDISRVIGNDQGGRAYDLLKQACTHIMGEVVDLSNHPKKFKLRHIVAKADFDETVREGRLHMSFHPDVVPYILSMFKEGRYTKIFLKHALPIRSLYSVRLYELLLQSKYLGSKIFSLKELRHFLDIPENKFVTWQSIKQRILEPAKKHLKEYTDICMEYNAIKKGVKVTSIEFEIYPNIPNYDPDSQQMNLFSDVASKISFEDVKEEHVEIVRKYIWKNSRDEVLKKYSKEYIIYYYKLCNNLRISGKDITDFNSFFYNSLREDRDDFENKLQEEMRIKEKLNKEKIKKQIEENQTDILFNRAEKYFEFLPIKFQDYYLKKVPSFISDEGLKKIHATTVFMNEMEELFMDEPNNELFINRVESSKTLSQKI